MKLEILFILLICAGMAAPQLTVSYIQGARLSADRSVPGHHLLAVDITNHRDYYILGQYVIGDDVDSRNVTLPIARKVENGANLHEPMSFSLVASDESGRLRYWKMNCPPTYEPMSVVANVDDVTTPDTRHYACVFEYFTRPYQLEFYDVVRKDTSQAAEMWKFVSYAHSPSFYFIFNKTAHDDDYDVTSGHDVTGPHAIDQEAKFAVSLRRHGDDDGDERDAIRGRSFKPRARIVSADVPSDVYAGKTPNRGQHSDVTATALIVASGLFVAVGLATYWVKQRNTGNADSGSESDSHKTTTVLQSTSSLRHDRPCHNINISYTVDDDDDDDVTPMTSRPTRIGSEAAPAVVNPYVDGSVEGLPRFNDVTNRYHDNGRR